MLALTFDDGPDIYTKALLDGLRERDVKASFFVLGKKAEKNKALIEQMKADGHLIGNHTYSHIDFLKSGKSKIRDELDKTDEIIEEITGEKTVFYRPPYGHYLGATLNCVDNKIAVLWSRDPADWKYKDEDYVYHYILDHARDGAIFLLHDTKKTTVNAVLKAVDVLVEKGYMFVRADELLCRNHDSLAPGLAYHGCKNQHSPIYF